MGSESENNIIEILDENGKKIYCELFNIIECEGNEYAMLLPQEQKDEPDAEFVVMKILEDEDDIAFVNLEDDEFKRVAEYIENMQDDEE